MLPMHQVVPGAQAEIFPSGIIDAVGESKEVTLTQKPANGTFRIKWSRTVSCSINPSSGFDSASASLELTIEKDKGSGWATINTVSYSASVVGDTAQSDSDSGPDSITHQDYGLEPGHRVRIRVSSRGVDPGSTGSAGAYANPDRVGYIE